MVKLFCVEFFLPKHTQNKLERKSNMSEFWGKRWIEALKQKTKALFQRTEQPAKTNPEENIWKRSIIWIKHKRKPILGTIATAGALGTIVSISIVGHLYVKNNTNEVLHVYVGDQEVGTVSDKTIVEELIREKEELIDKLYPNVHMEIAYDPITFKSERGFKLESEDEKTLEEIESRLSTKTTGTELWVGGELIGLVKDEEEAEKILEQYKQRYLPESSKGRVQILSAASADEDSSNEQIELEKVEFLEEIELKTTETRPENISTNAEIIHKLELGDTKPYEYTVQKGDCISCIASKFELTTDFIYQNNPQLDGEFIQIGDKLDLTVERPALSVQTVEKTKVVEDIPFGTVYEDDPEMRKGLQTVLVAGKNGKKRVEYHITKVNGIQVSKEVSSEQVIEPPQPKVVKRGTKVVAGVGTGSFSWPVSSARITSSYGKRWGTIHKGTDMVSKNRTIKAADSGTVTYAGWKNGYGNVIIIDHKNGYETLYGHLSKVSVSKGTKVEKGDSIGTMGNTGNSFGVHLHFEVIKNGKHQNPENYL